MGKQFVNLHTHSYYSLLEASSSPKEILQKAKSLEYPAVGLTDSGSGYGLIDFYEQAQKLKDIKPILGAEIFVARDSRFERRAGIDGREGHVVLIAQNKTGYQNLLKLISHAYIDGFYYKSRVDFELLEKYKEGLIALTGATGGLIGKALVRHGEKKAQEVFDKLLGIFGKDHLFVELVSRDSQEQKTLNELKLKLAKKSGAKIIVSSDARFIEEDDEEAADTLFCIGKNMQVDTPGRKKFAKGNFFKSWEQIEKELVGYINQDLLEEARERTLEIAESVNLEIKFGQNLLPHFSVEQGETEASQLRKNCEANLERRYGNKISKEVKDRLDYELSIIGKMGFEAYFLIVADFIRFAKANGIAVGPGRGSAAGSIVSYLLGITSIDPLQYELLFERFLNPERISMPDIDIDFSDERRDEVLQYVIEKYGAEKVSRVCTFGTMSAKAALKDVGRAQGVSFAEMNALTKILPNRPGFTLDDAAKIKDFKVLIDAKSHLRKVFDVAKKLEGCVRHLSVHACAVVIGQDDLTCSTPLQWAPGDEDIKITQFPYQQLEHLGLLKMDFLGLKNLSVLEKAIANVQVTTGEKLDLLKIPIDDRVTFDMMARGETTGVFQFESAGMRRYLKELKPTEFEDLVAMNALYRPGPMEYIPTYIAGKHNPKKVKYAHKVLEPILQKTYGIAVYQEQVLKIAQVFSGFSLGEADILRKAIGKKIASILAKQREHFIEGAIAKKFDKKLATKIFDEIVVPFSGYGFNRSHAVCYARIAYETAYLRANYPVEFMAAMMTTDRNNTDRIVLEMNECNAMGIEVLPPSVNESGAHFTVIYDPVNEEQTSLTEDSLTEQKSIRFGLTAIKGMGEETVNQIIFERNKNGEFESLQDFAKRVPTKLINKKTLEALAFSGALDEFGDRKAIVDSLDDLAKFAKEHQEKSTAGQIGLFGGTDSSSIEFALKDSVAQKEDILAWERESLGLFVTDHPLKGMGSYFAKYGTLIGTLTDTEDGGQKRTLHGIVTGSRKIVTRNGKNMAILTIEDTSGKIECAIFPQTYESIPQNALEVDAFLRVRGKIDERNGLLNMIVDEIRVGDLQEVAKKQILEGADGIATSKIERFVVKIPEGTTKEKVGELKSLLAKSKNEEGIVVEVQIEGKNVELPFKVAVDDKLKKMVKEILQ
ncbi:DNA polymerase III subunit alpha [Candidatus Gracilibacteria bacterium]|nr:DNA polymerase III subunit alpha [Candidatus Gracilibacteria bacterium]